MQVEAVVLHIAKYNDRSQIVHLYTESGGREQFMLYGNRHKPLLPLGYIDMEASGRSSMRQMRNHSLLYTPRRSTMTTQTVSIFIAEILYSVLTHPMPDKNIFSFLKSLQQRIDESATPQNLHLWFLLNFARLLGFLPAIFTENDYVDLQTGEDSLQMPLHGDYLNRQEILCLQQLIMSEDCNLSNTMRRLLLDKIIKYYCSQLSQFSTPRSMQILSEVWK